MSRKIIEKEAHRWTEMGIITSAQYAQIMNLYTEKKRAIGLVPILGSILVGLGILSFMAANWQAIPELLRLIVILGGMIGFYFAGETMLRKDHDKLGIALISLGLVMFGAGIILIAQMFHLEAYNATSWIVWGTAGLLLTYLYQSRYLYLITLVLYAVAQMNSTMEFNQFSYAAFILSVAGLGYYTWLNKNTLLAWLFSINFIIQVIMLTVVHEWEFLWVFVPVMLLYTLGDWIRNRDFAAPIQSAALIAAYVFDLFLVLFQGDMDYLETRAHILAEPFSFLLLAAAFLALSLYLKARSGRLISGVEWIVMPVLLYATLYVDVLYLFILFFFSLFVLWRGYIEEWRFKVNLGTILFLIITMTAYGKLAWDFMDKSLFFIFGGILLLVLSWFLNRRRKQFIEETKEDNDHDETNN
ncbi:DUF2157 domain-containing protein [Paenibacillus eucommiae]|uniref:Membrane protein n=1 Tax=Paenibacillus eucommiae TaxID=1355755 RepID=A0ABS4J7M9_9BACL|nr:DUF2157 domain-containing protein [Paenibacillus eucommiae]MBP1995854.1 putative membrane protein [Paenibacillus eucommiae]